MTTTCCVQLVEQCEDEELMDIVLPRLTKMLSLWELLLAKVHTHTNTHSMYIHTNYTYIYIYIYIRHTHTHTHTMRRQTVVFSLL